ncbi:EAL domain-containing protein [Micromonospora sp. WMMD1155]|uniref:EAL domain-containing protein n=1 Tax=Micromonospora sp. WMMD1155 TaxID=3016094 RepID=UPI0032B5A3A3
MSSRRRERALVLLTITVFAAALSSVLWATINLRQPTPYYLVYLVMGAAVMAVGAIFSAPVPPRIPFRITLTPTASLLCASVLPVPWVILCAAVGVTVARMITRYPRSAGVHKAIHNASMDVVAAVLAAVTMHAFGIRPRFEDSGLATSRWQIYVLGFLVAGIAVLALQEIVTTAAATLATGRPVLTVLRYMWRTRLIVGFAEVGTAGVVSVLTGLDMRALIALPAAMLVLHLVLTHRLRIREERRAWEHLAVLSDALASRDIDVVIRTAAAGAVKLFGAQAADIEIAGSGRLVRADRDAAVVFDGPAAEVPVYAAGPPLPIAHEIGAKTTGLQGTLRLYLRGPRDRLSARERSTLRAFSATLSTSLDIAHAYALMRHEAHHDRDTGMPNRATLLTRVAEKAADTCHVVAIRLENYEFLADAVGRDSALVLLNELATRLSRASRDASEVARVGDAEFALVMWATTDMGAYQRACYAVATLRRPIHIGGSLLTVRVSAGMTSGAPEEANALLDAAERVMWWAIRQGQDRLVTYQAGPIQSVPLARELEGARMSISFEPIVDLAGGSITMVQSVPRWLYSRYDVLAADGYAYQLLDDQDALEGFARTVLTRSIAAAATWRNALPHAALVVPIPARAVTPRFVDGLREALQGSPAGSSLVLALGQPADLPPGDASEQLRHLGVRLLLEDYGSSTRSIESLNAAPWHFLRVHPAYALDAGWRPARSVIRAAVDLAIDLDLAVIAPGIVSDDERRELAALGCALGSGPHFGGEMFPSQIRDHAALWQPSGLDAAGAQVLPLRLRRAGPAVSSHSPVQRGDRETIEGRGPRFLGPRAVGHRAPASEFRSDEGGVM